MPKYKVSFSGFAYVEADSAEEAQDDYDWGAVYREEQIDSCDEVEEFDISLL